MKSLSILIALVLTTAMLSINFIEAQQLPNLKISQISTPGGIKVGNCNKIKLMIVNNQQVGVSEQIAIRVNIAQNGQVQTKTAILDGIGPNDNSGQPVWFDDIYYGPTGQISIVAYVNDDQNIHETSYSDNSKLKTINAPSASSACPGSTSPITTVAKADLKIQVIKKAGALTISNGRSTPLSRAYVELRSSSGQVVDKKTSDSKGYVLFKDVPANKSYKITAKRSGCTSYVNKYKMPNVDTKIELAMSCK